MAKQRLSKVIAKTTDIAVIGLACCYPGASNVRELWENILARRIQFRRIPDQRLPIKDYCNEDPTTPDKTYVTKAAIIENFRFEWSKLRIPKDMFESSDIVHWLALDSALKALEDAGYKPGLIPSENTGVIIGNTLTGEQTRSQTLRLRWPYVQRVVNATLTHLGVGEEDRGRVSIEMEKRYKSAFPPFTKDSLVGGLANTIAGRICNYLNFKGGGYVVDGACSSSLLAVATAANALKMRDLDLALAGGVDVSLDPFELVGFAKVGALAKEKMSVYDQAANGFLPGEGCGFVVLKRLEDALRDHNYIYAVIRGWGISSDGKGGMMEPSLSGQALAIRRAYKGLDYKISDVDFIEGHGTGTAKGDKVELEAIATAIEDCVSKRKSVSYGITSFKSIVGHTKAAAGVGGFIKAVLAVNQRVLPPTAGCKNPNEIFRGKAKRLYPILQGECLPQDKIVRAGISSAGFGGINCHVTINSMGKPSEKIRPNIDSRSLFVSAQETEIFVFSTRAVSHFRRMILGFKDDLRHISVAEMADFAAYLGKKVKSHLPIKCAIITDSPEHLYKALTLLEKNLESISLPEGSIYRVTVDHPDTQIIVGINSKKNRIGFLYPERASQHLGMTRRLIGRLKWARELLELPPFPQTASKTTARSSLIWTEYLSQLGIRPSIVGGAGLGELAVFYNSTSGKATSKVDLGGHFAHQFFLRTNSPDPLIEPTSQNCDVLIEVGPSQALKDLVKTDDKINGIPRFSIESTSDGDRNLNVVLGELFVRSVQINWAELYKNRLIRTFVLPSQRSFIQNQCEHQLKLVEGPRATSVEIKTREKVVDTTTEPKKQERLVSKATTEGKIDVTSLLINLTNKMTGFDPNSISLDSRLLDDLNLDSIKAGELISESAKTLGVAAQVDPSELLNETLGRVRDRLEDLRDRQGSATVQSHPEGTVSSHYARKTWVRDFVIEYRREQNTARDTARLKGLRRVVVLSDAKNGKLVHEIGKSLSVNGTKVDDVSYWEIDQRRSSKFADMDCAIVVLPESTKSGQMGKSDLRKAIERFHNALSLCLQSDAAQDRTVVFVQYGGGNFGENDSPWNAESCCAKALGSTLHLERPDLQIRIVDFYSQSPAHEVAQRIIDELQTPEGFAVAGYDREFERRVPVYEKVDPVHYKKRNIEWDEKDVVLVTGGAKGITAECALEFARWTKAQLILVGRSPVGAKPNNEPDEIANTLGRFRRENLKCEYYQCDITNNSAVNEMVRDVQNRFGRIAGFIHGAGLNSLRRLRQGTSEEIYSESLPKVVGALNILNALEKDPPSLILALTSVIAVTGMEGSGWYGFANEVLNLCLRKYRNEHKNTHVQAIAYSVWDEVGMGVRLGSINRLGEKGIAAIPVSEGVGHFRRLVECAPGVQQVIVTARMRGIDTWRSFPSRRFENFRFIEDVEYLLPDVELIARARLNINDDSYLLDHNWKGSLLLPFVFGLEAMTQAVACVTGRNKIRHLKITNIDLERPIPINPDTGTSIGIYAQVLPMESSKAKGAKVKVEISSEQTGYQQPHFSAIFELDPYLKTVALPNDMRSKTKNTIGVDMESDIYGPVLFQGKLFHCVERIHELHYDHDKAMGKCVLTSAHNKSTREFLQRGNKKYGDFLIGDPFFIDSLFQSMQLIVAQDSCIPRGIETIELQVIGGREQRDCLISSSIRKIDDEFYRGDSYAGIGRIFLRMGNCRLKILGTNPNNPTANDLADPSARDQKIIEETVSKIAEEFNLKAPVIRCMFLPELEDLGKDERHRVELPVMRETLLGVLNGRRRSISPHAIKIGWLDSGQPIIKGEDGKDIGISISHTQGFLVCVAGRGDQGCDLEVVTERDVDKWKILLGKKYSRLLEEWQSCFDDVNVRGTAIWSAIEAIRKAKKIEPDFEIERVGEGWVTLKVLNSNRSVLLLTEIKFTRLRKSILALYLENDWPGRPALSSDTKHEKEALLKEFGFDEGAFGIQVDYSGPQGQYVFAKQYPVTFKTNKLMSRRVYFTTYFDWMGELREYSIHPIMDKLADMLETGGWGLATNWVKLQVLGELRGNDLVTGRVWMEESGGRSESIFDICYEWKKRISRNEYERTAFCRQRASWIKITGHGQGSIEELPESIKGFMDSMRPRREEVKPLEKLNEPLRGLKIGKEVKQFQNKHLMDYTFDTSLENSNLVGNIYFSNYARWLGAVGDLYFYRLIPDYYKGNGANGELVCVNCDVDHLREGMPFDRVLTRMYLNTLYQNGMDLSFEFYLRRGSEIARKLAVARQKLIWVKRNQQKAESSQLPPKITDHLLRGIDIAEEAVVR